MALGKLLTCVAGIGTYAQNSTTNAGSSGGGGIFSRMRAWIGLKTDQAIGHSFVYHVLAGYQFIMRYYSPGDQIYIFGFSRGAYTARFLAEMVHEIGLLSRGNEEMVHFAWITFSNFQTIRGNDPWRKEDLEQFEYMKIFKYTFCRPNVKVHFLGLFDCVNSVGQFEIPFFRKSFKYISTPPAKYIRHAVSIHERRLKFKPALFQLDDSKPCDQEIKEVWFAGNHADIGGGWPRQKYQQRLLSDIPLKWMIDEVSNLPEPDNVPQISLDTSAFPGPKFTIPRTTEQLVSLFKKSQPSPSQQRALTSQPHDMLSFNGGISVFGVLTWWIIGTSLFSKRFNPFADITKEILPIFTRLELEQGAWIPRHWPPNLGAKRDIPTHAEIHHSVQHMYQAGVLKLDQMPELGGDEPTLFIPSSVLKMWKTSKTPPAKPDPKANANGHVKDDVGAKTWGEAGGLVPKQWSLS